MAASLYLTTTTVRSTASLSSEYVAFSASKLCSEHNTIVITCTRKRDTHQHMTHQNAKNRQNPLPPPAYFPKQQHCELSKNNRDIVPIFQKHAISQYRVCMTNRRDGHRVCSRDIHDTSGKFCWPPLGGQTST